MNSRQSNKQEHAFTLIELLIVIGIIGLLIGIVVPVLLGAKEKALIGTASTTISNLTMALEECKSATGKYPPDEFGYTDKDITLAVTGCWSMVEALDGDGEGDRGRAFYNFKNESDLAVLGKSEGSDGEEGETTLTRLENMQQLYEKGNKINLVDPWGNPYRYRENFTKGYKPNALKGQTYRDKSKGPAETLYNLDSFDLWSAGPDGVDGTGDEGTEDNITNWD